MPKGQSLGQLAEVPEAEAQGEDSLAEPQAEVEERLGPQPAVEDEEPADEQPADAAEAVEDTMTDPLAGVERAALTKLRLHDAAVSNLRRDVAALRERRGSTSAADLRRLVEVADQVEELLGLPKEVLAREALAQDWPGADLAAARGVLAAVAACEAATARARAQICEEGATGGSSGGAAPGGLCEALGGLLSAWLGLREAELGARQREGAAVSQVDLAVEARASSIRPLCDALLDKAVEVYESLPHKAKGEAEELDGTDTGEGAPSAAAFAKQLRALLEHERIQQAVEAMQIEIPSHHVFQVKQQRASPAAAVVGTAPQLSQPPSCASVAVGTPTRGASSVADALQETATAPASPMVLPGEEAAPEVPGGARAPAAAAEPSGPCAAGGSAEAVFEPFGSAPGPVVSRRGPARTAADSEDLLARTVPGLAGLGSTFLGETMEEQPSRSIASNLAYLKTGSAELWRAVHLGDVELVKQMVALHLCNAQTRDASDHSVLWHAIAFNHISLANFMLDTFPPGTDGGADMTETHRRKGDTFLHLMCQRKDFGSDMAYLFKRISVAMPFSLFHRANLSGLTFLQIAASSLNFWVLTFFLRNFPVQAKTLVCAPAAPMRTLTDAMAQPAAPQYVPPEPFPEHFRVADLLQQDEAGLVPYADVAFDVGPDNAGVAACRFLAHRIVVISQSPVLFEALEKLPLAHLPREKTHAAIFRVDPRVSQEVWRSILQFMYTGVINCTYGANADQVVELLRACALYMLPKPLLDYAQFLLYPLLPRSPPQVALQVLAISSSVGKDARADFRHAREASAYLLLRSAHRIFEGVEPAEVAAALEWAVQAAEHAVFNPVGSVHQGPG